MIVRQEESTPIGNFFHDSGVSKVFTALETTVDDFEVNTDQLLSWCDFIVDKIKLLKGQIKKVETAQKKYENSLEINLKKGVRND